MPDLEDGSSATVQGSGSSTYDLKNSGGVYSCSCPAWRNQSLPIEARTCKHLKAYRGEQAEIDRVTAAGNMMGTTAAPAILTAAKAAGASSGRGNKKATAPPVLLAHPWENDVDLTGWWISEKLDGVRCWWDGKVMWSRLGNMFHPPDWFVEGLPETPLDGELFGGRKNFQKTNGIVKRQDKTDIWKQITFMIFDAPQHGGLFEERQTFVQQMLDERKPPYAKLVEQKKCEGIEHMREELAAVEALGGEGLMMRKPGSKYEPTRSSTLLKVKTFYDSEAIVVEHLQGTGKHKGRLGALRCEMGNGRRFAVGTGFSDKERENPPAVGTVITYRYQELTDDGSPRFPSYVGVRVDAKWPPDPDSQPKAPAKKAAAPKPATTAPATTVATTAVASPPAAPVAPKPAPVPQKAPSPAAAVAVPSGVKLPTRVTIHRFFEISVEGSTLIVKRGDVGSGMKTTKKKVFPDAASAEHEARSLIEEKLRHGYKS